MKNIRFLLSAISLMLVSHSSFSANTVVNKANYAEGIDNKVMSVSDAQNDKKHVGEGSSLKKYITKDDAVIRNIALGINNTVFGKESSAVGYANHIRGMLSHAYGGENIVLSDYSTVVGFKNNVKAGSTVVHGYSNNIEKTAGSSVVFAHDSDVSGHNVTFAGLKYKITGNNSGVFGKGNYSRTARPNESLIQGEESYVVGNNNSIVSGSDKNFILGNNISIGAGIVESVVLGNDSTVEESHTVSVGREGAERKIVHVAKGAITSNSTDAINGSQIFEIMNNLNANHTKTHRKLRAGIAGSAALANIPQAVSAGHNSLGIGIGSHNGQNAVAVGYSRVLDNNKVVMKISGAVDSQQGYTAGAGMSYQWK